MTAIQFAGILRARRAGPGRWQARCPAHDDKHPSLSISDGHDGRVLLYCFAGCAPEAITKAVGLRMSDLFPGPPPMPQQARQAAQKREEMELRNRERRAAHGAACDRIRKLERIAEQIAGKLARFPDDAPDADEFAHLFHSVQDSIHRAEAEELAVRP